jgi:hypothetical protein
LRSAKVKLANVIVHGPQFINVIDLVGMEDQRPLLVRVGRVPFGLRRLRSRIKNEHHGAPQSLWTVDLGIL